MQVLTNEIKRKRIINQYKDFYSLYYEAVERQSKNLKNAKRTSAQERVGSVVNITVTQKGVIA